ncbi:MAG TPA: PKD-like family lipoprotein, partial [Parasegetibacter sp.]
MKLTFNIVTVMVGMLLLTSCLKDTGNYEYDFGNEVTIRHPTYSYTTFLGDTLTVIATRVYSNPEDTTEFDHKWYINGELYSEEPTLKFVGKELGSNSGRYYMVDRRTGIHMNVPSGFTINVTSPYQTGWGVLYEKGGKSELAHIRVTSGQYFDYVDVYKKENNNEEMGSQPVKIRDYPVQGGRGMFVIQHGGQGSMEMNAYTMKKAILTSNSFIGSVPPDFRPVDMGFFATADLIFNHNGDVYPRFFQNPIPFTVPWINVPMQISKGMKVTDFWDSWNGNMAYGFMHDKLNNRVLYVRLDAPNVTGGVAVVDTMPTTVPANPVYPDGWVNLNDMGDAEYIWGGTFLDGQYTAVGAMLLRDPVDGKVYYQSFNSKSVNRLLEWSPKSRFPFLGEEYLTPQSKFVALKSREYLFFTGGPGNNKLYYFDVRSGSSVKFYNEYPSAINVITASDNSNELAVGLENGTVIIQDVSNTPMINGT